MVHKLTALTMCVFLHGRAFFVAGTTVGNISHPHIFYQSRSAGGSRSYECWILYNCLRCVELGNLAVSHAVRS